MIYSNLSFFVFPKSILSFLQVNLKMLFTIAVCVVCFHLLKCSEVSSAFKAGLGSANSLLCDFACLSGVVESRSKEISRYAFSCIFVDLFSSDILV